MIAYNHYLDEGVTIDRMFDNDFVPREYLNIYVDLKVLFTDSEGNTDLVAATKHWFDYGRAEGRKGRFEMPEWFDAQAYQDTHHDVVMPSLDLHSVKTPKHGGIFTEQELRLREDHLMIPGSILMLTLQVTLT